MNLFIASLLGALIQIAGTLVGKVLLSLGFGYVVFSGVDASIAFAKAQFVGHIGALPAAAVGVMAVMKVGTCVSMLTSAVAMRLMLAGLTSGTLRKMVLK